MTISQITCSASGCNALSIAKGLCGKHYMRFRRHGTTDRHWIRGLRTEGATTYIPLTQGYEAIVDSRDAHLADGFSWYAKVCGNLVYAVRASPKDEVTKGKQFYLHRIITDAPNGIDVDHINGNALDNRRDNLRLVTHAQNTRNSRLPLNNTSGFKGVYWNKGVNKWVAQIALDGTRHHLGIFDCPKEAHEAYCEASKRMHGEYGRTR